MSFASHETYFAGVPFEPRPFLVFIQTNWVFVLPDATRSIIYNLPSLRAKQFFYRSGLNQLP